MQHATHAGPSAQARPTRTLLSLAACGALALVTGTAGAWHYPALGEGSFHSSFKNPGFPEGIVVEGSRYYVSGPAQFDETSTVVRAYNKFTGALLETINVTHPGSDPADALSSITSDRLGRLYVISEAQGIVRLTKHNNSWTQQVYAPLPSDGLPGCRHAAQLVPSPSDPWMRPACHLLNDLAFDAYGRLYVTDSMRATIYRVKDGGGAMTKWFESPYLVGGPPYPIGVNGVRVSPTSDAVYFTVTTSPLPELAGRGALYKLPIVNSPDPGDLEVVRYFDAGLGPDGIAFGEDGEIYAALAFSNQVSIMDQDGDELTRLSGPSGSSVPYDAPANIAFDGWGSILVTNHALLSADTTHMGTLKVYVGDRGDDLFRPYNWY